MLQAFANMCTVSVNQRKLLGRTIEISFDVIFNLRRRQTAFNLPGRCYSVNNFEIVHHNNKILNENIRRGYD